MTERPYRKNVAMIVINDQGQVLTGERSDLPNVWQLPQGGVDEGESDEIAALRELKEEIGTNDVEIIAKTEKRVKYDFPEWLSEAPIAKAFKGQAQHYFLMKLVNNATPDIEKADSEFIAFKWMEVKELINQITDFKKLAYEKAFAEFAKFFRNP